jgi:transcriptional regulator with XRE-family HTH domain
MPLPKGTQFPADPKERLDAILKDCFGNSRLALARAASVSRALVNRWPPGSKMVMDRHLLTAIEHELDVAEERVIRLREAKYGIEDSVRRQNQESEVHLRASQR